MTEAYPPVSPNTRVRTTQANWDKRSEWTTPGWNKRKWGIEGTVLTHHDSHGLYYDVRHDDGSEAGYDPSEFVVI